MDEHVSLEDATLDARKAVRCDEHDQFADNSAVERSVVGRQIAAAIAVAVTRCVEIANRADEDLRVGADSPSSTPDDRRRLRAKRMTAISIADDIRREFGLFYVDPPK